MYLQAKWKTVWILIQWLSGSSLFSNQDNDKVLPLNTLTAEFLHRASKAKKFSVKLPLFSYPSV